MVFVKPTPLTLALVPILSKLGVISSLITLAMFALFMAEPLMRMPQLPQVNSGNPYFNSFQHFPEITGEITADRLFFNSLLVTSFWFQHSLLARSSFKSLLNVLTGDQYYHFEKPFYALTASMALSLVIFCAEPIGEVYLVAPWKGTDLSHLNVGMAFMSYLMVIVGVVVLGITVIDMYRCDILGAQVERYMRPEGLD